jgi:uncharacterized protein DUF4062
MVSSTIGELSAERRQIADSLAAAGIADGWLFELHATAAGEPPKARYLDVARSCDLYVIIIAAQGSGATEAEYHAAYEDNPRKVLPFFVGDRTDATKSLRALIESRHVRVHREDLADLPTAVVDAITDHVRSGEVVRPPLVEALDRRLQRSEQVVSGALPLSFIPTLRPNLRPGERKAEPGPFPATSLPAREHHIVLEGIGGSGKTYGALAMLHHASGNGKLPVVVQPTNNEVSIRELIVSAFEAVRFFPGDALFQQLARDGRLGVLIDGIDGIASDQRRVFLADVDEFARRFPRSLMICCMRRALPDELRHFARFTLEPLSDEQTADMFRSVDAPEIKTFPTQVADLARWPLWAWALLEVGPSVPTGLVLLQQLLDHRVRRSAAYSPIETEMLVDAAGALAFDAWPQPSMTAHDALTTLTTFGASSSVRSKFAVPPAQTVIERLSAAGIVQLTPDVVFAHPLFATFLGARHAVTAEPMTSAMAADPEFAMFVAALLGEDRGDEKLACLLRHGPVGQARYLRLAPETPREPEPDDPLVFGAAVKMLSGSAAECIVTDEWTAWRAADDPGAPDLDALQSWFAAGDVNFLPGNAFQRRSPVDVATIESLARFKDHVVHQRPREDRFDRLNDAELKRLRKLSREELNELILQAALDWRREWREQAVAMGISTLPETAIGDGDPQVIVYEDWPDPGLRIEWGGKAGVSWVQPGSKEPAWGYRSLSRFLDPGRSARIYEELVERAEQALGCTFGSQAWSRPEHVAAWAW